MSWQRTFLALKTPEMKACIQKSFATDGCFTMMRSDEMQQSIQLDATLPIAEGVKDDENVEEMDFDAAAGRGNECD